MLPVQTDVLIVGAGPTGLALATALQQAGVDHLLVDALERAQNTSRAGVVHPHTLEMLERIGVTAPLSAEGTTVTDFTVRDRDQPLLGISYAALPSAFRHMLLVPQSTTEAVLQAQLDSLGGDVHRGVAALGVTVDANGAAVHVKTAEGERTVLARYVVGADGMHSVIREAAGIAFQGAAYGESFVLADVCMDWPMGNSEVSLFFSPAGLVVVAPLPDGSYRVVATVDDAPDVPGIDLIQQLLDARGPVAKPAHVTDIVWSSRFRVHHRLADTYRKGPILLMGDAAHVHSPAGGQGMNAGLVDAIVLGDALIRVVRDGVPDSVLDDYAATRRPAAQLVLGLASRLTRMATVRSALGRRVRNVVLRILNRIPPFKRNLSLALSGISRRKYSVLPDRRPLETPFAPAPRLSSPGPQRRCDVGSHDPVVAGGGVRRARGLVPGIAEFCTRADYHPSLSIRSADRPDPNRGLRRTGPYCRPVRCVFAVRTAHLSRLRDRSAPVRRVRLLVLRGGADADLGRAARCGRQRRDDGGVRRGVAGRRHGHSAIGQSCTLIPSHGHHHELRRLLETAVQPLMGNGSKVPNPVAKSAALLR